MGRATIISGGDEGYYTVALFKDAEGITVRLAEIAARLATLATAIAAAETAAEQSRLRLEQLCLQQQQTALTAATTADARAVWCADLTEDLEAGAEVGTIEVNGETGQILITPGGDTAAALGRLQHPAASTPAGVAYNMALMPAWQKWRPTYRIGEILGIDTGADTCTVGIEDQRSRYQGIPINQDGTTWEVDRAAAVSGWDDFAARNPSFALVTNSASTTIANTQALAADLAEVNAYVNSRSHYTRDEDQYGKLEHWTVMTEGGAGDCEDYALTKAQILLDRGYPASALHIEVGQTLAGEGHAWLIVQTDGGDIALDNNYSRPMRSWELPYTDRMRQTGADWQTTGVQLADVPIVYMDGVNAMAFEVGDRVVVRFIDQDWERPEVIGFETWPRPGKFLYGRAWEGTVWSRGKYRHDGTLLETLAQYDVPDYYGTERFGAGDGKIVVPTWNWGSGTPGPGIRVDFRDARTHALIRSTEKDLWESPISSWFPARGFTREQVSVTQIGGCWLDEYGRIYVGVVITGSTGLVQIYVSGFVRLSADGSMLTGIWCKNYGGGVYFTPPVVLGGAVADGWVYLADRGKAAGAGFTPPHPIQE